MQFMLCVNNAGYTSSLEFQKLYRVLPDREAKKHHQIRVIDESGEDYLYPEEFFAPVSLPLTTQRRLKLASARLKKIASPRLGKRPERISTPK